MVDRGRVERSAELGTTRGLQLIGVQLEAQPGFARRLEDFSGFIEGEDSGLAKHVREARDSLLLDLWKQLLAQESEKFGAAIGAAPILVRDLVGPKPGRDDAQRR